jgi:hypothetical protein
MAATPTTLQLRYLQTLTEISSEHHSTVIFPVPIDIIGQLMRGVGGDSGGGQSGTRRQVPLEGEEKKS